MPAKRASIPPQAQVPVAIVLSILFAIILYWRFGGGAKKPMPGVPAPAGVAATVAGTGAAAAGSSSAVTSQSLEASITQLRGLLAQVEQSKMVDPTRAVAAAPLASDPFAKPTPTPVPAAVVTGELIPVGNLNDPQATSAGLLRAPELIPLAPIGPSRAERVAQLSLSAVLLTGDASISVINNKYRRVGESVAGFTLSAIDEHGVTLRDDGGTTRLQIRANNLLASALEQSR